MTKASLEQSDAIFWDYTNALFYASAFFPKHDIDWFFPLLITSHVTLWFVTESSLILTKPNSQLKQTRRERPKDLEIFAMSNAFYFPKTSSELATGVLLYFRPSLSPSLYYFVRIFAYKKSYVPPFTLSLALSLALDLSHFLMGLETIRLETLIQSFEIGKKCQFHHRMHTQFFNYSASPSGYTHHTSNFDCCAQ